jgi:hypothetical protein
MPSANPPVEPHPPETRTYGDYLGIAGVFAGFASFYGESYVPNLVSSLYVSPRLAEIDANLYLIGSPKVNVFTREFLAKMQDGPPGWKMEPLSGDEQSKDPMYAITGVLDGAPFTHSCVPDEDWGLIVRGPHPGYPSRVVAVLAGARALGTGSACLAATNSQLIKKIRDKLNDETLLTARDRTIWVLVKGHKSLDGHLDPDGVEIVAAGAYQPK